MTLGECIRRTDALRPNTADEQEKARWVFQVERELEEVFFPGYEGRRRARARQWPEDKAAPLLASGPFEELYLHRVLAHLALMDQELDVYNAHNALARQMESDFKKAWERQHRRRETEEVRL